jgi:hypothetical protein
MFNNLIKYMQRSGESNITSIVLNCNAKHCGQNKKTKQWFESLIEVKLH